VQNQPIIEQEKKRQKETIHILQHDGEQERRDVDDPEELYRRRLWRLALS